MDLLLGPLVADAHRITPVSVVRCSPLLAGLIDMGCRNGVVFPSRLEGALKRVVSERGSVDAPANMSLDLFIGVVAEHIRLCFSTLRQMILDDSSMGKVKKTGAFRKQLTAPEHVLVTSLLSKMS